MSDNMMDEEIDRVIHQGQHPGDILLFYRATGLNHVITWFTRSQYYHVAICVDHDRVVEARPQGVTVRDLHSNVGGRYFKVIRAPEGKGRRALDWALAQRGAKYDRFDLVVIILERLFRHLHVNYAPKGKYSCAEFVAKAFEKAGVELFPDLDPNAVVPADFARLLENRPEPVAAGQLT